MREGPNKDGRNHLVSCKKVDAPLIYGGQGVGDLRRKNLALLSKWLWRFIQKETALWKTVIKSKYGRQMIDGCQRKLRRAQVAAPRNTLVKTEALFKEISVTSLEMGKSRSWEDRWAANSPFCEEFPSIYVLANSKRLLTVRDCWSVGVEAWDLGLFDRELEEWAGLTTILEGRKPKGEKDKVYWDFSSKSTSKFLYRSPTFSSHNLTSLISKGNSLKNTAFFIWSIARGNLNTTDRNQKQYPPLLCNQNSESSNHIFLHCPFAYKGWMFLLNLYDLAWCTPKEVFC